MQSIAYRMMSLLKAAAASGTLGDARKSFYGLANNSSNTYERIHMSETSSAAAAGAQTHHCVI